MGNWPNNSGYTTHRSEQKPLENCPPLITDTKKNRKMYIYKFMITSEEKTTRYDKGGSFWMKGKEYL